MVESCLCLLVMSTGEESDVGASIAATADFKVYAAQSCNPATPERILLFLASRLTPRWVCVCVWF